MRIDEFEFRNEKGQEIEPTKAQLVIYIKSLHKDIKEKDQAIESLEELNRSLGQTCYNDVKEIERLNELLAEKEKENAKLKEVVNCVDKLKQFNADMKDYALVNRDVADEIYCEHQDKISFAVEQLVGVQKYIDDNAVYIKEESFGREINGFIDNQIKQLKEGK